MIFTILSILIAIGWCFVVFRMRRMFRGHFLEPQNRALLVALVAGCAASAVELVWLSMEWYRPPVFFKESWKFIGYAVMGAVCSIIAGLAMLFAPGRKGVPQVERRIMIFFSSVTGIFSLLMLPLSVVFS